MARINRYDQPAQAQFINTYAPYPIEQIMNMDMFKAARIEEGERRADEFMAGLHDFPVDRADEPDYQKRIQGLQTDLDNIVQKHGNLGTAEARRELSALVTKQVRDPWWRAARANYAARTAGFESLDKAKGVVGATEADWYDLEQGLYGYEGVESEFAKGNTSGMVNFSSTFAPTNPIKFLEDRAAAMKPSGVTIDRVTNDWIITEGNLGIAAESIGAVYGLYLKKTEEGKYDIDAEKSKIQGWFIDSPEGARIKRETLIEKAYRDRIADSIEAETGERPEVESENQIFSRKYFEMVSSIVDAKTHGVITLKYSPNPFGLHDYKKSSEDLENVLKTPVLVGGQFSEIRSVGDMDRVRRGHDSMIAEVERTKNKYMKDYDVKNISPEGVAPVYIRYEGDKEIDVTDKVLAFDLEREQYELKNKQLDQYLEDVYTSVGLTKQKRKAFDEISRIVETYVDSEHKKFQEAEQAYTGAGDPPIWEPNRHRKDALDKIRKGRLVIDNEVYNETTLSNEEIDRITEERLQEASDKFYEKHPPGSIIGGDYSPTFNERDERRKIRAEVERDTKNVYKNIINEYDSFNDRVKEALKVNAEKASFTVGMTSFGSKLANEELSNWFVTYVTEGEDSKGNKKLGGALVGDVFDLATGAEINDPKELKAFGSKPPLVQGHFFHPQKGICISFRPYDKDGNLMKPVAVEAPIGIVENLINKGRFDSAQYLVMEEFRRIFNTYDKRGGVGLEIDEDGYYTMNTGEKGYSMKIKMFHKTEAGREPSSKNAISILLPRSDGKWEERNYSSYGAAAADFVALVRAQEEERRTAQRK